MFVKSAYLRTVLLLVANMRVLRGVVNFFSHFYTFTNGCAYGHWNDAVGIFFGLSFLVMTGRSPNRYIAQGNTLGVSELSNLRSERAAGGRSLTILPIPFALSERRIVFPFLPRALPWAVFSLGFQPVIAARWMVSKK